MEEDNKPAKLQIKINNNKKEEDEAWMLFERKTWRKERTAACERESFFSWSRAITCASDSWRAFFLFSSFRREMYIHSKSFTVLWVFLLLLFPFLFLLPCWLALSSSYLFSGFCVEWIYPSFPSFFFSFFHSLFFSPSHFLSNILHEFRVYVHLKSWGRLDDSSVSCISFSVLDTSSHRSTPPFIHLCTTGVLLFAFILFRDFVGNPSLSIRSGKESFTSVSSFFFSFFSSN